MANTRVQELMEMIKNTTDPDQLAILKFDLDEAMGRKDSSVKKGVKKRSGGGNYGGDEVMAAKRCKGGGIAVKGTGFKGTF